MKKNLMSENGEQIIDDKLGFLERILKLIYTYGLFRVFGGLLVLLLFGFFITLFANQETIIKNIIETQTIVENKKHSNKMLLRVKQINPQIDAILLKLLIESGADRAFIIEMHNGSNNPTGLPFVYGEITYEQTTDPNTPLIAEEYGTINLSRYSFVGHVFRDKIFKGSVDDLYKIDYKLANRLDINEVKYMYMVSVTSTNIPIGFLGLTYIYKPINFEAEGKIINASQKIAILLDLYLSAE